ncbi:MAG: tRNA pseudouridine(55) synthase TruB [Pirellulales bacterium]|nr:tRNA pseudouridine(55) synthase TruB [Pirellulales bacterium]
MSYFGFLCCDKPAGMTSRDVVNIVQRRIRPTKVGHAGTLDPLAQGVLVLGVGPAVRLVPYVQQQPKHYHAVFRLGQSSLSGDLEGEILNHPELPVPTSRQLREAASQLIGTIEQVPPAHSAIWVDGQRAYRRIRAGQQVDMPERKVEVHQLAILRYQYPEVELEIVCGSGTYIRTLGTDLAEACGSKAVMTRLDRTAVGPFHRADAVTLEQLREAPLAELLINPVQGVSQLRRITIDHEQSRRLGHGLCLEQDIDVGEAEAAAVTADGQLRAIVRPKRGRWCPYRVFPESA